MSQNYAVPCSCGATVAVESRQAGDQVRCAKCDEFVAVPPLRELKRLEVVDAVSHSPSPRPDATKWNGLPGGLFAVGLLLIAIAGGSAAYTWNVKSQIKEYAEAPTDVRDVKKNVLSYSLVESWEAWGEFKKINLSTRPAPIHVLAQNRLSGVIEMQLAQNTGRWRRSQGAGKQSGQKMTD